MTLSITCIQIILYERERAEITGSCHTTGLGHSQLIHDTATVKMFTIMGVGLILLSNSTNAKIHLLYYLTF